MKSIKRREFIKAGAIISTGIPLGLNAMQWGKRNSKNPITIGVIGTGDRGAYEAYILKETPGIEVVACCDIIPKHLQNGLEEAGSSAKGYADYKQLLKHKNLDAVLICTPQHLHYQMALDAIAAKKHIICQKTMTLTTTDAMALSKMVKKTDRVFQVAYQWQSSPLFNRVHQMISEGKCGQITHIRSNYNKNMSWRVDVDDPALERQLNWRMYREYSGGLMAELCSHHINVANWMLNAPPQKVTGFGGTDFWKDGRETYDNVNTIFEYPGGIKASFQATITNAYEDVSFIIMGTEGTIVIQKEEGQIAHYFPEATKLHNSLSDAEIKDVDGITSATRKAWARGDGIPIEVANNTRDDFETTRAMFLDFVDCVKNNKTPRSNIENGRNVAIAVDMANKAMRNGTIEYWKPEYSG